MDTKQKNQERIKSSDEFRGFTIFFMIIVNFLAFYEAIPLYLKHAQNIGLTAADLVAPCFLFIIGLLYKKTYLKRVSLYGRKKTWLHIILRYLMLLAIGVIGVWTARGKITGEWGVLQTIGVAGLLTLPFIELTFWPRIFLSLGLAAGYQIILFPAFKYIIIHAKHGGPYAAISWSSMLLLATAAGDLFSPNDTVQSIKKLLGFATSFLFAGIISLPFVPISKMQVNFSYVLVTTGISTFAFIAFLIINDKFNLSLPTFKSLGRNALLIYIVHYVLVRIGHRVIPSNSGLMMIMMGATIIYLLCYVLAWLLDINKLYLKL